jgi:hypothetical protein
MGFPRERDGRRPGADAVGVQVEPAQDPVAGVRQEAVELHCLRGELLAALGGEPAEIETAFVLADNIARGSAGRSRISSADGKHLRVRSERAAPPRRVRGSFCFECRGIQSRAGLFVDRWRHR